ncbi:hypothetical protein OG279_37855 (plasmid) [Streptomyces sp. NBC_01201]|uniref:Uncharacterized protein n=1 Tax=Streptomyces glycanivorans TaxID=3033808 RepID=A0ABY9JQB0_9ACTN|nr:MULTISPECIES: hypothetical protein [unclassified Streptomyces]WLQ69229.1 hypothetical protein P8A20_37480 [Streptomyces sp. Alt3]WSR53368.1 hypothetical protein OG279_37855 [Streptomyces sp. NBC_01201]
MSQDLNAELSRIYERCLEQVRTIAALDPTKPVVEWDRYTCTSANEFASDVEMAWMGAHPEHKTRDTYSAIMGGVPVERESVSGDSPTRYITYGLTSFARVLQCIEAMRASRFDPHVSGGIIRDDED